MPDPKTYHFKLPSYQGSLLPEPPHSWYPGVPQHYPHCTSERTLRGDGKIRAFVIHATAGASSSGAISVLFNHRASWHWLIPDENEPEHGQRIWACAPEKRAAWHVRNDTSHPDVNGGSRYPNYWSLGVELVNTQQDDPFSDWQLEQAAALVRYAWSKYPTLVDVVSHAKLDPARRSDPGQQFQWERFRALVLTPAPTPSLALTQAAAAPIRVIGPNNEVIECDARPMDGVIMVAAQPLLEALGFHPEFTSDIGVSREFDDSSVETIRVRRGASRVTKRSTGQRKVVSRKRRRSR